MIKETTRENCRKLHFVRIENRIYCLNPCTWAQNKIGSKKEEKQSKFFKKGFKMAESLFKCEFTNSWHE